MWTQQRNFFYLAVVSYLSASSAAADAQIRLVDEDQSGSTRCSGNVEIYHNNSWGTVCDDDWDLNEAEVVCRELGCGKVIIASQSPQCGQRSGPIWLDGVNCSGRERSLTECQHSGFGTHLGHKTSDIGVTCSGAPIRLAGSGSTLCSGRVEIYHNNSWGTVCDDGWDLNDAEVVCRELGCGKALNATQSAHFGEGTGEIWLDDVSCSGSERSLTECQHRGFGTHNCTHSKDAGVICSDLSVRLSGSTLCSGRVEIYHNNSWGKICDDGWDLNDAEVVCRQLGCGKALNATHSAHFGEGTGPIWLTEVSCSGSESSLTECQYIGFVTDVCGHHEDAGVICSVILPKPRISMNPAGKVEQGNNVSITCSISPQTQQFLHGEFTLKQISGSFNQTETSTTNSATFQILKVDFDKDGLYECQYSYNSGFSRSDSASLSVTDSRLTVLRYVFLPLILLLENIAFHFYYKVAKRQKSAKKEDAEMDVFRAEEVHAEEEVAQEIA